MNLMRRYAMTYCGNTREPFAISIAGSKLYVLTKASDVAEAYRNIKTLSYNVTEDTVIGSKLLRR